MQLQQRASGEIVRASMTSSAQGSLGQDSFCPPYPEQRRECSYALFVLSHTATWLSDMLMTKGLLASPRGNA